MKEAMSTARADIAARQSAIRCWVCEGSQTYLVKKSNRASELSWRDFLITDMRYGVTGELVRCKGCGFLFCPELADVDRFYEGLEDPGYEETRGERLKQMRRVLDRAQKYLAGSRVLDVGAGAGIMVEAANERGLDAVGIEPSAWLAAVARERGLPVIHGFFPNRSVSGSYDLVTLVDVLEHVSHPVQMLRDIRAQLGPSGIVVVNTPDVSSVAARLLGSKWWHFRTAHIGYFDRRTLEMACLRAGLRIVRLFRPSWYLDADYLWRRVVSYLPARLALTPPSILKRITIPLNLRDSWMAILEKGVAEPEASVISGPQSSAR